jgi:hypothetical protein
MSEPETDLITGAENIAEAFLGSKKKARVIYHWSEEGFAPLFKIGNVLCARRSTFAAYFAEKERASLQRQKSQRSAPRSTSRQHSAA